MVSGGQAGLGSPRAAGGGWCHKRQMNSGKSKSVLQCDLKQDRPGRLWRHCRTDLKFKFDHQTLHHPQPTHIHVPPLIQTSQLLTPLCDIRSTTGEDCLRAVPSASHGDLLSSRSPAADGTTLRRPAFKAFPAQPADFRVHYNYLVQKGFGVGWYRYRSRTVKVTHPRN